MYVEVGCDLFAKATSVEAGYSPSPSDPDGAIRDVRPIAAGEVRAPKSAESDYRLVGRGGKPVVRLRLEPGGPPVTIGRAAGNRVLVDDESVSKFHATITLTQDNRIVVADLGSTNGTTINGDPSPIRGPRVIGPGDTVVFGDIAFTIEKL